MEKTPCPQQTHCEDELSRQDAIRKLRSLRRFAGDDSQPALVIEGLYIGSIGAARNCQALADCGVGYVVNASPVVPCFHKDRLRYRLVHVYDDAGCDIAQYFDATNRFIRKGRRRGGVLVHCFAGQSRSTALVIAYLLQSEGLTFEAAWRAVTAARPSARPNSGFMRQLLDYAAQLGRQLPPSDHPVWTMAS